MGQGLRAERRRAPDRHARRATQSASCPPAPPGRARARTCSLASFACVPRHLALQKLGGKEGGGKDSPSGASNGSTAGGASSSLGGLGPEQVVVLSGGGGSLPPGSILVGNPKGSVDAVAFASYPQVALQVRGVALSCLLPP